MVSKASVDFPEPDGPVTTVMARRGNSTSMCLRLWSRAPRTTMRSFTGRSGRVDRVSAGRRRQGGRVLVEYGARAQRRVDRAQQLVELVGRLAESPAIHRARAGDG